MAMMTFFTEANFAARSAGSKYEQYWLENRGRLPDVLLRLQGGMLPAHFFGDRQDVIYLHDARIQAVSSSDALVTLHLHGDHHGGRREITLQYSGVERCSLIPEIALDDTPAHDVRCHETALITAGRFNHKLLLVNSEVLSIDFSSLGISITDHPPKSEANFDSLDEDERRFAIINASKSGDASSLPQLLSLLNSDTYENRRHVARALANIGGSQAEAVLLQLLGSESGLILGDVARSLGRIGSRNAVSQLTQLLDHELDWVRSGAREALKRLGKAS